MKNLLLTALVALLAACSPDQGPSLMAPIPAQAKESKHWTPSGKAHDLETVLYNIQQELLALRHEVRELRIDSSKTNAQANTDRQEALEYTQCLDRASDWFDKAAEAIKAKYGVRSLYKDTGNEALDDIIQEESSALHDKSAINYKACEKRRPKIMPPSTC